MSNGLLNVKKVLRDYFETVLVAVVVAVFLRAIFIGTYRIPTFAMYPSLAEGDFLFGYKWAYGLKVPFSDVWAVGPYTPKRGDVVVFHCPKDKETSCIKRVVALPGEEIEIQSGTVRINRQEVALGPATRLNQEFEGASDYERRSETFAHQTHYVLLKVGQSQRDFSRIKVPDDSFFVLGDARDMSEDSRDWGPIPIADLESRAGMIWLSLNWERKTFLGLPGLRVERLFSTP